MKKTRTWTLALLAIALTVTLATNGLVLGKGKPPKDDPPTDPPPVTYELTWIALAPDNFKSVDRPSLHINNNGDVLCTVRINQGDNHSLMVYTAADGILRPLSDSIDPDSLLHPELGPLSFGWWPSGGGVTGSDGINDLGQIACTLQDQNGKEHLVRYTPPSDGEVYGALEVLGLPDPSDQSFLPFAININGDICGRVTDANGDWHAYYYTDAEGFVEINAGLNSQARDINDSGQVIGFTSSGSLAFRYSSITGIEYFSSPHETEEFIHAYGINNSGDFVGRTIFPDAPRGRNAIKDKPFLYSDSSAGFVDIGANITEYGKDVNENGDVVGNVTSGTGFPFIYLNASQEFVRLDEKVFESPDVMWVQNSYYRDLKVNNSGQICMYVSYDTYGSGHTTGICILTPCPLAVISSHTPGVGVWLYCSNLDESTGQLHLQQCPKSIFCRWLLFQVALNDIFVPRLPFSPVLYVKGHAAQDVEVGVGMLLTNAALVFAERYVRLPLQRINERYNIMRHKLCIFDHFSRSELYQRVVNDSHPHTPFRLCSSSWKIELCSQARWSD